MKPSTGSIVLGVGVAVGVGAVIAGAIVVGTPTEARLQRLDEVRARDLRTIAADIERFTRRHERLPASLRELVTDPRTLASIEDPSTQQEYEYRVLGETSYELCAVFDLASNQDNRSRDGFWSHEAGRHCFPLTATTGYPSDSPPAVPQLP